MKHTLKVLYALVLVLVVSPWGHAASPSQPNYGITIQQAWLELADGVRLAADLYMPEGAAPGEKFPVLLEYLPYRKDESRARNYSLYSYWVQRGYVVARVDMRNHRKVAVFDGRVGYTGSQNIASASFAPKKAFAPWVDCMLRIEGPVVRDLQDIFAADWYLETEEAPSEALALTPEIFEDGIVVQVLPTGV